MIIEFWFLVHLEENRKFAFSKERIFGFEGT